MPLVATETASTPDVLPTLTVTLFEAAFPILEPAFVTENLTVSAVPVTSAAEAVTKIPAEELVSAGVLVTP